MPSIQPPNELIKSWEWERQCQRKEKKKKKNLMNELRGWRGAEDFFFVGIRRAVAAAIESLEGAYSKAPAYPSNDKVYPFSFAI